MLDSYLMRRRRKSFPCELRIVWVSVIMTLTNEGRIERYEKDSIIHGIGGGDAVWGISSDECGSKDHHYYSEESWYFHSKEVTQAVKEEGKVHHQGQGKQDQIQEALGECEQEVADSK